MTESLKADLHARLGALAAAEPGEAAAQVADLYHADARWSGSHPLNEVQGAAVIADVIWGPAKAVFPDMERRDGVFITGRWEDDDYIAALGHYQANFDRDWLDIPATHSVVQLRYGEVHQIRDGRIIHSRCLWDLLDLMRQAGFWPIAPSVGAEIAWPAPHTNDGVALHEQDRDRGARSLAKVLRMHDALNGFDGRNLASMSFQDHWIDDFMWYGPAGIGSARGLRRYQNNHSIPFLTAFPDRKGGYHYTRIGDGNYVATGGWGSVIATHAGDGWLGMPATGKRVEMRVMDFYRLERDGLIAENWVPIDVIDVLRQIGFDVFDRLRHLQGRAKETL